MKKIFGLFVALFIGIGAGSGDASAWQLWTSQGTADVVYANAEGTKATYRVSLNDFTPAASATDAVMVQGSATKIIRITKIAYSADATGAGALDYYITKRLTPDTGGTSSVPSVGILDSRDPAPSATVKQFSANPTLGTSGVVVAANHYAMPAAASTGYPISQFVETFGGTGAKALVLRNASEVMGFSFNGQTIPAGTSVYVTIEWTEE